MLSKVLAAVGLLGVFGLVAALMLVFLPKPLVNADYLVIGSVSTLVTLGAVFFGIIRKSPQSGDVFYKKRRKR